DDAAELRNRPHQFRQAGGAEQGFHSFQPAMMRSSVFELELFGSTVPLRRDLPHQRAAAALEKRPHAAYLLRILLVSAALEAGRQAHFHFGINAAGKRRVGVEVEITAPHFEGVERIVEELPWRRPCREWPKVNRRRA